MNLPVVVFLNVANFPHKTAWRRRPSTRRQPSAATWSRSPSVTRTSWFGTSAGRRTSEPAGTPTTATQRYSSWLLPKEKTKQKTDRHMTFGWNSCPNCLVCTFLVSIKLTFFEIHQKILHSSHESFKIQCISDSWQQKAKGLRVLHIDSLLIIKPLLPVAYW